MRIFLAAAVATGCVFAAPAQAQDRPPAYLNAEACLRARVAEAVEVTSGAVDASEFLLGYLCAETVSYAIAYQQNTASLLALHDMTNGMQQLGADSGVKGAESPFDYSELFGSLKVDPVTGAFVSNDSSPGLMGGTLKAQAVQMGALFGDRPPTFLRALAGELVLQARR